MGTPDRGGGSGNRGLGARLPVSRSTLAAVRQLFAQRYRIPAEEIEDLVGITIVDYLKQRGRMGRVMLCSW